MTTSNARSAFARGFFNILLTRRVSILLLLIAGSAVPDGMEAAPPYITGFSPTSGPVGTTVTITGNFTDAYGVTFFRNINAPSVNFISDTQLAVGVPARTTTGTIRVTTPDGTNSSTTKFQVLPGAVRSDYFQGNTLPRDDDALSADASIGFSVNIAGTLYDHCFVNQNGNITFGSSLSEYTPFPIGSADRPILAVFFADVDTRVASQVTYGSEQAVVNGHNAFGANYINVGYYSQQIDKFNTFQVVIVSRDDTGAGNFDVEFNYNQILWETGDASGGGNPAPGYGGTVARAGIRLGASDSIEVAHSGETFRLLDRDPTTGQINSTGLVYQKRYSDVPGRLVYQIRNGVLVGTMKAINSTGDTSGSDNTPVDLERETSATDGNPAALK